jgi:hypothetical protein
MIRYEMGMHNRSEIVAVQGSPYMPTLYVAYNVRM